ncbi:MAG: hypothetical protein J6P87_05320, partial [Lachnospiraceae bacterium]|nr:hypothetical protein [Lachnospiraceae bacterium]
MRRKLLSLLLCICLFSFLTGFVPDPRAGEPAGRGAGTPEPLGILYRKQPAELVNSEGDVLIEGNTFLLYLSPSDAAARPALQKWIEDFNREREEDQEAFIRDQTRDVYTQFENGLSLAYSRTETFIPVRADSAVLSFAVAEDTYLGGAHGYRSYQSFNIDPLTGKALSFSDIITDTEELPD